MRKPAAQKLIQVRSTRSWRRCGLAFIGAVALSLGSFTGLVGQTTATDAEGRLVAAKTRPALDLSVSLPALADVLGSGIDNGHGPALERWTDSWSQGVGRGARIRDEVYRDALPPDSTVPESTARSVVFAVRAAMAEVDEIPAALPLHLSLAVVEARRSLAAAEKGLAEGDWAESAVRGLRAADALRETLPSAVALTLIDAAESALPEPPAGGRRYDPPDTGRARRLTRWARSAVDSGDHTLAIHRAYYACQLLGVILP